MVSLHTYVAMYAHIHLYVCTDCPEQPLTGRVLPDSEYDLEDCM